MGIEVTFLPSSFGARLAAEAWHTANRNASFGFIFSSLNDCNEVGSQGICIGMIGDFVSFS
jgi:hypothetical protein